MVASERPSIRELKGGEVLYGAICGEVDKTPPSLLGAVGVAATYRTDCRSRDMNRIYHMKSVIMILRSVSRAPSPPISSPIILARRYREDLWWVCDVGVNWGQGEGPL